MTHTTTAYQENVTDFLLEVPRENILENSSEFSPKWGVSTNLDNGVLTDIWNRANPTDNQDIWLAPTAARIHQITSTDTSDDFSGLGCRALRISGLTSWTATDFTTEIILMNGTSNVATSNSYVILHRMESVGWGARGPNQGTITATADTDGTVTAQIEPLVGQTQMAIFGIPSTKTIYITDYDVSIIRTASSTVTFSLVINPSPNVLGTTQFIIKHNVSLYTSGVSSKEYSFQPYFKHAGPAIIKIQALSDANNVEGIAAFDFIVVDN